MRVADREQAKCVGGFGSTTRINTRLLALNRTGLLRRFFLGTTASGRKALYSLSKRGAELVGVPYRGLRRGNDETVVALAKKYDKTPAQIVLRWGLQKGLVVIPKSDKEARIIENKQIFGWNLENEDVEVIDALDEGQKANLGEWDPYAWD